LIAPDADAAKLMRKSNVRESQLMDALEYGRIVHAEMSALSDAARCGHAVRGAVMYCTTFPCHMCAKHIVAAGISNVMFLEPYPKSLAFDLHADSIQVEAGDRGKYKDFPAVQFEHFHGVSPRRYREIFERAKRKDSAGVLMPYRDENPSPIVDIKFPFYAQLEQFFTQKVMRQVNALRRTSGVRRTKKSGGHAVRKMR
jgi:deoxycytidylate deaminase